MTGAQVSDSNATRVAVIGAGGWGEQHARVFSRRPDTELVAVVGRTRDKTDARAAAYGSRGFTDVDQMLDTVGPDLVSVCLPNEQHFEVTRHLLERGIPLLVEKPLVFSLAEADELLDIAAAGDIFFGINFNHRFAGPVQRALMAVRDGQLGDPVFVTWRFGGEANFGNSPHANLIETQCHGLDMLELLLGPISSVMAQMTDKTYGAYSTIAVALEFENRAVGTMLGSYDSSYAYPDSQLVEVNGTLGRVIIHDTVRSLSLQLKGDEVAHVWQAGYFNDEARYFAGTFDRHVDRLIPALREGGTPPVPATAGRRALELADAIIRSHQSGERIRTAGES